MLFNYFFHRYPLSVLRHFLPAEKPGSYALAFSFQLISPITGDTITLLSLNKIFLFTWEGGFAWLFITFGSDIFVYFSFSFISSKIVIALGVSRSTSIALLVDLSLDAADDIADLLWYYLHRKLLGMLFADFCCCVQKFKFDVRCCIWRHCKQDNMWQHSSRLLIDLVI